MFVCVDPSRFLRPRASSLPLTELEAAVLVRRAPSIAPACPLVSLFLLGAANVVAVADSFRGEPGQRFVQVKGRQRGEIRVREAEGSEVLEGGQLKQVLLPEREPSRHRASSPLLAPSLKPDLPQGTTTSTPLSDSPANGPADVRTRSDPDPSPFESMLSSSLSVFLLLPPSP